MKERNTWLIQNTTCHNIKHLCLVGVRLTKAILNGTASTTVTASFDVPINSVKKTTLYILNHILTK